MVDIIRIGQGFVGSVAGLIVIVDHVVTLAALDRTAKQFTRKPVEGFAESICQLNW